MFLDGMGSKSLDRGDPVELDEPGFLSPGLDRVPF